MIQSDFDKRDSFNRENFWGSRLAAQCATLSAIFKRDLFVSRSFTRAFAPPAYGRSIVVESKYSTYFMSTPHPFSLRVPGCGIGRPCHSEQEGPVVSAMRPT
jgi:hypothetical protein